MAAEDDSLSFYNQALIALAAGAQENVALDGAHLSARAVSPVCGSEVEVQLSLNGDAISAFGFSVEACALTRAVVSVMRRAIIGKTRRQVADAGRDLESMLKGNGMPSGDWEDLKILAPVRDYQARHNSILLPFEAVEKAFRNSG